MSLMNIAAILLFCLAFFSSALSTFTGFGSALILISATSLIFGIKWSIAITTFLYTFNTLSKSILFRNYINWYITFYILISAIPTTILGSFFLISFDAVIFKSGLAIIALLYLLLDLIKFKLVITENRLVLLLAGSFYGFLSGAIGTGSLVKAILLNQFKLSKKQFVATMAATALPLNLCKIAVFTSAALIDKSDLPLIFGLLIASFTGTILGRYFLNKLPEKVFYHLVRMMLFLIALKMLLG